MGLYPLIYLELCEIYPLVRLLRQHQTPGLRHVASAENTGVESLARRGYAPELVHVVEVLTEKNVKRTRKSRRDGTRGGVLVSPSARGNTHTATCTLSCYLTVKVLQATPTLPCHLYPCLVNKCSRQHPPQICTLSGHLTVKVH